MDRPGYSWGNVAVAFRPASTCAIRWANIVVPRVGSDDTPGTLVTALT
ncbi:hypothetical protein [Actinoallomurus sp. CA-142502]